MSQDNKKVKRKDAKIEQVTKPSNHNSNKPENSNVKP